MASGSGTKTPLTRPDALSTTLPAELATAFVLGGTESSYKHQYANLYFVRLAQLRKHAIERAKHLWSSEPGNPTLVPRILNVSRGQLCWIVGTVYKDMPLKDNVLDDLAREHGIAPPPPRLKFHSDQDQILLEDESGRIILTGEFITTVNTISGLVVAVLGAETASGDFEVKDLCYPGAAPQNPSDHKALNGSMDVDESNEWIAIVSGLSVGPPTASSDLRINMLIEYLLAEVGDSGHQKNASVISRLIVAGNSFAPINYEEVEDPLEPTVTVPGEVGSLTSKKAAKKYGYEGSDFMAHPTQALSAHFSELSRSLVVHLIPGPTDPAGATLPQQPLPRAMFGTAKNYESFHVETNPCWIGVGDCHVLASGGQPLDDIFRYVKSSDRLELASEMIKWRHMAPSAPDTLWCYPYVSADPFIMARTPHIYCIGNQPRFETAMVQQEDGQRTRVILVPRFCDSGDVVLVNPVTLEVKSVRIDCSWDV